MRSVLVCPAPYCSFIPDADPKVVPRTRRDARAYLLDDDHQDLSQSNVRVVLATSCAKLTANRTEKPRRELSDIASGPCVRRDVNSAGLAGTSRRRTAAIVDREPHCCRSLEVENGLSELQGGS